MTEVLKALDLHHQWKHGPQPWIFTHSIVQICMHYNRAGHYHSHSVVCAAHTPGNVRASNRRGTDWAAAIVGDCAPGHECRRSACLLGCGCCRHIGFAHPLRADTDTSWELC